MLDKLFHKSPPVNIKYPWFVERDNRCHVFNEDMPKLIALYLPQFHPIPENDDIWERNFTEWTNVTKALPQFIDHYQPRLPYECGFYDLRLVDNIKWQAELSKQYGIYGWCIMYYFFAGKVMMDTPLKLILENPDIDINFCLEWANESWSRRWDGRENDITVQQTNDSLDILIRNILDIAQDPRYIRIDNKPVIVVYRRDIIDDIESVICSWREIAKTEYNEELYLIICETFDNHGNPEMISFDASLQYPPHPTSGMWYKVGNKRVNKINPNFEGHVHKYDAIVENKLYDVTTNYTLYKMAMLDWDNTARRDNKGTVYHGCNPDLYNAWLTDIVKDATSNNLPLVFINAWNEWAEGTYLEPDRANGYRYLYETRKVIEDG